MTKKQLSVIIVTFNSEKYIFNCLSSVVKNLPNNYACNVIIADNNSEDNTVKIIRELLRNNSNVTLLSNGKNIGFAKSVNICLKHAKASGSNYFLLLNPDVVINKTSISALIDCLNINMAGIAGGNTFNEKGIQNGSYFRFPNLQVGLFDFTNLRKLTKTDYWHKYFYYLDQKRTIQPSFPVDVITGGYMILKEEVLQKIGYFNERYFMYLEDIDYCLRANKVGIGVVHCNKSNIIHFSGGSSNNKDRIRHSAWLWSRKIYFIEHFGLFSNIIIQTMFLIDDVYILFKKSLNK